MYLDSFLDIAWLGAFVLLVGMVETDPDPVVDQGSPVARLNVEELGRHARLRVILRIVARFTALHQRHFPLHKVLKEITKFTRVRNNYGSSLLIIDDFKTLIISVGNSENCAEKFKFTFSETSRISRILFRTTLIDSEFRILTSIGVP